MHERSRKDITGTGGVTILVVEDNQAVLEALVDALTVFGYTVFAALNGAEALAITGKLEEPVDLIVSDYMMPGMNALTMHGALTAVGRAAHMLILTGYPLPFTEMELDEEHEVRWARKPIDATELRRLIAEMISKGGEKKMRWPVFAGSDPCHLWAGSIDSLAANGGESTAFGRQLQV